MLPSIRGGAPRSAEAWITAGSQAPSQDQGGGAGGVFLLQTQSGLSEAINSPGPSPQSSGQSLGKMENHKACKDPISLLWFKHCSSSFSTADITGASFTNASAPGKSGTQSLHLQASCEASQPASSRTSEPSWEPPYSAWAPSATCPHLATSRMNNQGSQILQFGETGLLGNPAQGGDKSPIPGA